MTNLRRNEYKLGNGNDTTNQWTFIQGMGMLSDFHCVVSQLSSQVGTATWAILQGRNLEPAYLLSLSFLT